MTGPVDLLALSDLPDPGAVSLTVGEGRERREVLLTRHGPRLRAFVDACPHAFVPLGNGLSPLLDGTDPSLLVCSFHGARFEAETGRCVSGPCRGRALTPLAIAVADGRIQLTGRE